MSIISIIPARSGSKGIVNKNISNVHGHPLFVYTVAAAINCPLIDVVLVSTDSIEYAKIAIDYGADVPFLRPFDFAGDLSTTESTLQLALLEAEKFYATHFDYTIFLSPTDFFRLPHHLNDCINNCLNNSNLESSFCCQKTSKNFWSSESPINRLLPWMKHYSSRQVRSFTLREDTGRACCSKSNLIRSGLRIGNNVLPVVTDDSVYDIDIHTPFDLFVLNNTLEYLKTYSPELFKLYTHGLH